MTDKIIQEIVLQGEGEVVAALNRIGKAGDQALGTLGTSVKKVDTKALGDGLVNVGTAGQRFFSSFKSIGGVIGEAVGQFGSVAGAVGHFTERLSLATERVISHSFGVGRLTRGMPLLGVAIIATAGGFIYLAKSAADATDAIISGADKAATTTDTYQTVGFALRSAGLTGDQAATALATFGARMDKARETAQKAGVQVLNVADGMDELQRRTGIVVNRVGSLGTIGLTAVGKFSSGALAALPPVERLFVQLPTVVDEATGLLTQSSASWTAFADALSKIPTKAEQARTVIEMFGNEVGRKLLPFLSQGSKGISGLINQFKILGLSVSESERASAAAYAASTAAFTEAWSTIKRTLGSSLTPILTKSIEGLTSFLIENMATIVSVAKSIASAVVGFFSDIFAAIQGRDKDVKATWILTFRDAVVQAASIIGTAFTILMSIMDGAAAIINGVFGTKISGGALLLIAVFGVLTGAFAAIATVIGGVITAGAFLAATFTPLVAILASVATGAGLLAIGFGNTATAIGGVLAVAAGLALLFGGWAAAIIVVLGLLVRLAIAYWPEIVAGVKWVADAIMKLPEIVMGAVTAMMAPFVNFASFVKDLFLQLVAYINDKINAIGDAIKRMLAKTKEFFGIGSGAAAQGGATGGDVTGGGTFAEGFASGGPVRRRGGNSNDTILGWFAPDEFIMRGAVVRRYGKGFLDAINGLQLPAFAMGGLAGVLPGPIMRAPAMAMAGGGSSSAKQVFNLNIGGETFGGLTAPEETASRLVQYAVRQQVRNAGRKPSWVR